MHEKRKKYYHIRKDLFWCTILLAVSFLIGYAIYPSTSRYFSNTFPESRRPKRTDRNNL